MCYRLAALQKRGDTDWKKRLTKVNPENDLTVICSTAQINHHHVSHVSVCIESNLSSGKWKTYSITNVDCYSSIRQILNGASEELSCTKSLTWSLVNTLGKGVL